MTTTDQASIANPAPGGITKIDITELQQVCNRLERIGAHLRDMNASTRTNLARIMGDIPEVEPKVSEVDPKAPDNLLAQINLDIEVIAESVDDLANRLDRLGHL